MSMILDNLISNAVKFVKEEGHVKIIFKSDSSRGQKEGSGMGLAISAEILKQMKLSYIAENVDGGVMFSIYKKGCK